MCKLSYHRLRGQLSLKKKYIYFSVTFCQTIRNMSTQSIHSPSAPTPLLLDGWWRDCSLLLPAAPSPHMQSGPGLSAPLHVLCSSDIPQPWLNLRLAWLVVSGQLEATVFNSSLALCLAVTGTINSCIWHYDNFTLALWHSGSLKLLDSFTVTLLHYDTMALWH